MSSVAQQRGWRKGIRSLAQTIAGGGLTALVAVLAGGLSPGAAAVLTAAFSALAAYLQNYLETAGSIPTLLPTSTVVVPNPAGALQPAAAVLETSIDTAGDIVGEVLDVPGDLLRGDE